MRLPTSIFTVSFVFTAVVILNEVESLTIDRPYVKTPLGGVKGKFKISTKGRKYAAFFDIPYALPPVGDHRFEPPSPAPAWSKDIDSSNLTKLCIQDINFLSVILGEEDCLYLNIFVPVQEKNASLPVVFWIHGGGFILGSKLFVLPGNFMDRDLILVTINYRLGAFGFMSTGDEIIPGNMGLKDQNMALRWVVDNIKYFEGDPNRITLSGESAGAASVHYHYLSPMSRGLFQNGMSFSGTAISPSAHVSKPKNIFKLFGEVAGCESDNTVEIVECLKKIPANILTDKVRQLNERIPAFKMLFAPVSENTSQNYFINRQPIDILKEGPVYDVPWVTTTVKDEAAVLVNILLREAKNVSYLDENWRTVSPYLLYYAFSKPETDHVKISDAIRKHFFAGESISEKNSRNITKLIEQQLFRVPLARAVELQSEINKSPVWSYYYRYGDDVTHCSDVFLAQAKNIASSSTTPSDKAMVEGLLDFWYSFANSSEPKLSNQVEWTSSSKHFKYLHVAGPKSMYMEHDHNFGDIEFWNSIGL